ncbi:hypothetical protein [Thalassotalea maritima]|uniref:hypothetical protein n=1 Tax=Thalassotalea maritima TaxID=3242416 RepID=UPI0035272F40
MDNYGVQLNRLKERGIIFHQRALDAITNYLICHPACSQVYVTQSHVETTWTDLTSHGFEGTSEKILIQGSGYLNQITLNLAPNSTFNRSDADLFYSIYINGDNASVRAFNIKEARPILNDLRERFDRIPVEDAEQPGRCVVGIDLAFLIDNIHSYSEFKFNLPEVKAYVDEERKIALLNQKAQELYINSLV